MPFPQPFGGDAGGLFLSALLGGRRPISTRRLYRCPVHRDRRSEIPFTPEWFDKLRAAIPSSIHADIAGAATPVCSPGDKTKMAVVTGAVAVDMESVGSAIAAFKQKLPFAALRVVADPSHRSLPPAALSERHIDGTTDLSAVWRSIVAQPSQLGGLLRLALDTQTARAALVRSRRQLGMALALLLRLRSGASTPFVYIGQAAGRLHRIVGKPSPNLTFTEQFDAEITANCELLTVKAEIHCSAIDRPVAGI
jgi:hypothetical protein